MASYHAIATQIKVQLPGYMQDSGPDRFVLHTTIKPVDYRFSQQSESFFLFRVQKAWHEIFCLLPWFVARL